MLPSPGKEPEGLEQEAIRGMGDFPKQRTCTVTKVHPRRQAAAALGALAGLPCAPAGALCAPAGAPCAPAGALCALAGCALAGAPCALAGCVLAGCALAGAPCHWAGLNFSQGKVCFESLGSGRHSALSRGREEV